jgi:collagen type VII alpha
MANEKISALPVGGPAQPTDAVPIARAGSNYQLAVSNFTAGPTGPTGPAGAGGSGIAAQITGNTLGTTALISTGTLAIAGGSNITLSQSSGQAITIIGAGAFSGGVSNIGNTSGATGITGSNLVFAGGNNMTLSQSVNTAGATVSFSAANQSVQTQASGQIAGTGFATTTIAGSTIGGTLNTAGMTLAVPGYLTTQSVQTQASGNIGATGFATTTVAGAVIAGTNNTAGFTLGVPAYLTTQSVQTQASGAIAGTGVTTTTQAGSTLGVTHNTAGLSLAVPPWVTAGGGGGGIDVTLGGNTSGALALVSTGTLFLAGGTNITLSQNGNSVSILGATAAGLTTGGAYLAGNTTAQSSSSTYNLTSFNISAAGIVSAGWSSNSLIISAPASVGLTQSLYATSNTTQGSSGTQSIGSLVLAGAGGVSVGVSNGSYVISGGAAAGLGAVQVSNTTYTSGTVTFQNANGLSFGSSGANGVSGSYTVPSQVSLFALGNTTQNSSTVLPFNALSFNGLGEATVGFSNGSIQISNPQQSLGVSTGGNTSGNTGIYSGQVVLAGGNNITLSVGTAAGGAQTITISGAAGGGASTAGLFATGNTTNGSTTTVALSSQLFNFQGGVTGGFSNGSVQISAPPISSLSATGWASVSVNGSTISVGAAAPQLSFYQPLGPVQNTTLTQQGNGTVQVYPALKPFPFTASRVDMMVSVSLTNLAVSTEAQALSMYVGLYSLNGSTLSLASSGSQSYQWSNSSAGSNNSISGMRRFSAPINVNYTGGFDLFVGLMTNTTFSNIAGVTMSNVVVPLGPGPQLQGLIGQVPASSMQFVPGQGIFSTTSAGMPSSMALSAISGMGSGGNAVDNYAPLQFVNVTA